MNKSIKSGGKGSTRDWGAEAGHREAGKGCKTRVSNVKQYADNFAEINWGEHPIKFPPRYRIIYRE